MVFNAGYRYPNFEQLSPGWFLCRPLQTNSLPEFKQERRQRQRYETIGLMSKNNSSARNARAFYMLVNFYVCRPLQNNNVK